MAPTKTQRIDQENMVHKLRQRPDPMAVQEQRSVLAVLDNNKPVKLALKGKQSVKESTSSRSLNENKKFVVPVKQFEAFKVYEDEEDCSKSTKQRFREEEKSAVDEIGNKIDVLKVLNDSTDQSDIDVDSETTPSCEDKLREGETLAEDIILQSRCSKTRFFEIEEYREDIYAYLRKHEMKHRAKTGYIVKQPDVTVSMRAILVDWLVEVVQEYKMNTETLYLAVNYIDRFLSYMSVVRAKLQLVGTAAMLIAAKYEEVVCPHVSEFVYITDDTYDQHQVIRMEHLILRVLGFDVSIPTPLTFINAMCIMGKCTEKIMYLAMYLSELGLLEVEPYLQFLPSTIAASAIALARHTLGYKAWPSELSTKTGYETKQLEKCIYFMYECFLNAPNNPQHAIRDKYMSPKFMHVAKLVPNSEPIEF